MRCLCCDKELINPTEYERSCKWHSKCIKKFFGTVKIPDLAVSEEDIEMLANSSVNEGLTVPGVQKKLSLHLSNEDGVAKLTIVDYPTGYIFKPQSKEYEALPEAEYLVMKMAEQSGIEVVPNALVQTDGVYSYITKRVDRTGGAMLAMEDFCQLSGRMTSDKYKSSYENCGKVIRKFSQNVGLDEVELFYRLVFCYVTGNSDMHLKNFSLIEKAPRSRVYGLSPAYDLLPVNVIVPADKEQMALTLNGKKQNIRKKDFLVLADNLGINEKTAKRLMDKVSGLSAKYIEMIDYSYIPETMKDGMKELITDRVGVLA